MELYVFKPLFTDPKSGSYSPTNLLHTGKFKSAWDSRLYVRGDMALPTSIQGANFSFNKTAVEVNSTALDQHHKINDRTENFPYDINLPEKTL